MASCEVNVPNLVAYLNWTHVYEWRVIRCGSKIRHLKDMYIKEIILWAQNLLTILGSTVSIIGGAYLVVIWLWHF